MMGRQGHRTGRSVSLEATPASILEFEDFVDSLDILSPKDRNRLKLAGGEILDNIVKHATPLESRGIEARASRSGGSILLAFYFRSPSFAVFAGEDGPWSVYPEPLFDPAHRRWRGMGLLMCRNLAKRLVFRPGESMDRIFLEFEAER
jgi:anti-sigma regulatory factor (Ser/Thr protein kinase)